MFYKHIDGSAYDRYSSKRRVDELVDGRFECVTSITSAVSLSHVVNLVLQIIFIIIIY